MAGAIVNLYPTIAFYLGWPIEFLTDSVFYLTDKIDLHSIGWDLT
jgi:hypothetical protein